MKVWEFIKQPSTVRGILILAGLFGYNVDPSNVEAVSMGTAGALGVFETFRNGRK